MNQTRTPRRQRHDAEAGDEFVITREFDGRDVVWKAWKVQSTRRVVGAKASRCSP